MSEIIEAFAEEFSYHWEWLMSASLKVTAWFLLAGAVLQILRNSSASIRHAVAVFAAIGVPMIFVLDLSPIPEHSGWRPFEKPVVSMKIETESQLSLSAEAEMMQIEPVSQAGESALPKALLSDIDFLPGLVALWWLGFAVAGIQLLKRVLRPGPAKDRTSLAEAPAGLVAMAESESRRLKMRRVPSVAIAPDAMPMTCGLRKAVIVLPPEAIHWREEKVTSILRHELIHVRRRDLWWTLAVEAALLPVWWHPLARMLKRRVSELTEQACDDAVISFGSAPADYANDLLSLARRFAPVRPAGLGLPAISSKGQMARFRRVLDERVCRRSVTRARIVVIGLLTIGLVVPGTLFVDCIAAETEDELSSEQAEPSHLPAVHPAIAGVSKDAETLTVSIKFFEAEISASELFETPEVSSWMETEGRFLSPDDGFRLFHPHQKGVDILTAPKITTPQGQEAKVEVAREIIFPTNYETDQGSGEEVPVKFETTKTGIVMTIRVRATDDPGILEVEMEPSVTEVIGWVKDEKGHDVPRFRSQKVSVNGRYQNGSYLYLGKHTDQEAIEDRVPVLGDIPLLGVLFRTEEIREVKKIIAVQVIVSGSP